MVEPVWDIETLAAARARGNRLLSLGPRIAELLRPCGIEL
jgi:hypothetical protein